MEKQLNHSILSIKFLEEFRTFREDESIIFKPGINLLCGDNGCGKSSLILAMTEKHRTKVAIEMSVENECTFYYLDTEKHNPRTVSDVRNSHMTIDTVISSKFGSHGETILPLVRAAGKAKNTIIFLDEPEAGLSIRSQYKILESLLKAQRNGCQLFVSTHSAILMEAIGEVLSLEHKKWMNSQDFINSQK